jgi:hypothetical protein
MTSDVFLLATHSNLVLLDLNEDRTSGTVAHLSGGARFYGVAFDGKEVWVVKNTREHEDISTIEGLFSGRRIVFEAPLKDVHQITYANGGLYVCNTYYNGVVFKDLERGVEHVYTIGGPFEHDYEHPNSIWVDGPYVWVLCHNKRFRRSEVVRLRHHRNLGFDNGYLSEVRLRLPFSACHNLRFDGSLLTYIASESDRIAQIDALTGTPARGIPIPSGYAKGMALVDSRTAIFGLNPNVPVSLRYDADVAIGFVDLVDMGFRGGFDLRLPTDEPLGNINEIRRLPRRIFGLESKDPQDVPAT